MKRLLAISFTVIGLGVAGGCAYFNTLYNARLKYDEAQDIKKRAEPDRTEITNQEERLYTEAFEKAAKVVKFYPDSKWVDDALMLMGKSSLEKGDYSTALRKFEEIHVFFPDSDLSAEALLMQGRTLVETREFTAAVEALSRAAEYDKKELRDDVTYFLGVVQYEEENPEVALGYFTTVVKEYRKSEWFAEAGLLAGGIAEENGEYEKAVDFYEKVWRHAKTPKDRFRGGMAKGGALLSSGLSAERARNTFHDIAKEVTTDYERGKALLMKGEALQAMGDTDGAMAIYNDLISSMERKEAAASAQLAIARIYDDAGDLEQALGQYELVKEQGTGHPAWQEASRRQTEIQTVLDLRAAIANEEEPEPERKRYLLAEQLLEKIGDVDGALEQYASLATDAAGTEWGARAIYAQAWVFEHRLDQPDTAEVLLEHLANHYNGTEVDAAARRRFGYPVWQVEEIEPPPVYFIRPEGEDATAEEVVLDRVTPRDVPLPPGVSEVKVWVRVSLAADGTVESAKVVKSGGEEFDAACLEAAQASTFLAPSAGGPSVTVVQYVFPEPGDSPVLPDASSAVPDSVAAPFETPPVDSAAVPFPESQSVPRLRDRNR